jgi:hypothetical protein
MEIISDQKLSQQQSTSSVEPFLQNTNNRKLYFIIFTLTFSLLGIGYYITLSKNNSPGTQVLDTSESSQISHTTQGIQPIGTTHPATVDETTNWKIYTSLNMGYSFKYPQNLTPAIYLNNNDSKYTVLLNSFGHDEKTSFEREKGVPIKKAQFNIMEDVYKKLPPDSHGFNTAKEYLDFLIANKKFDAKENTLKGHRVVIVDETDNFGDSVSTTYSGKKIYILKTDTELITLGSVVFSEDSAQAENRNLQLDKILSTFQFTN